MQKEKMTSTQMHLQLIRLLRDQRIMSYTAIKEYLTKHYSSVRQTHYLIISNLKKSGLVDERIGDDGLKYLVFRERNKMHHRKYKHPATICFAVLRLLRNNGAILLEDVRIYINDHYSINQNTQGNILRILLSSGFVLQKTFNNHKYLEYKG